MKTRGTVTVLLTGILNHVAVGFELLHGNLGPLGEKENIPVLVPHGDCCLYRRQGERGKRRKWDRKRTKQNRIDLIKQM